MWIGRQDLLYTIRAARREPLLSIIAVLALSLGIGLNAGVFTLLNALFLSPPTQTDVGRFVQIYPRYEGWFTGAGQYSSFTTEDFRAIEKQSTDLDETAAWNLTEAILEERRHGAPTALVSCNYFHVLGVDRPLLGRLLSPQECKPGSRAQVAVLSEAFWKLQFAGNSKIVGTTIHLNGMPFTVVGIMRSQGTNFNGGGIYIPFTDEPVLDRTGTSLLEDSNSPWLQVAGRLRPGARRADAQAELTTIMRQEDRAYVERNASSLNRKTSIVLTNGSFIQNPAFGDIVFILMVLIMGPLFLVLMLACCNVTMLFLSRAVVRRGEIAIRLALGVGKARLMRMLVLESSMMALVGGVISIALTFRVPLWIMSAADPYQRPFVSTLPLNWRVFGFLALLVTAAAVVSSLAPMHAAWRLDLVTALKGREAAATVRSKLTGGLIVAQIAMSFVLISAAVWFSRMPQMATGIDPGFDTRHTLSVPLQVDTSPKNRTAALNLYRAVEDRILAIPGVQSLAWQSLSPFRQNAPSEIRLAGQKMRQGKPAVIDDVSADFFSTFGIRMMAGRAFVPEDSAGTASSTAVVSQAFARQFWPGTNPIDKIVVTPDGRRFIVVGVASDLRSERFGILDGPRIYTLRDPSALGGELFVRFAGTPGPMETAVRDAVKSVDPTQTQTPQTIWERLESTAEQMRSLANIVMAVASIALLLAITGVYGVLSFSINRRTREFGIRMVMGANRGAIFRSVLLRGGRQIGIGLACGIALAEPAAWTFAREVKNSPFVFKPFDGSMYLIAAVLLVAVSLAAMYLPALRATQVEPGKALRTE
jgi:predicted permease